MELESYLNNKHTLPTLKRFANVGSRESFSHKLDYLTRLAEEEKWYYTLDDGEEFSVIFYYIIHTFERVFNQNKLEISENKETCIFNTGLISPQGEEIYGLFEKSNHYKPEDPTSNYWHFKKFLRENEKEFIKLSLNKPQLATYFDDYNELYFDPNVEISLNFDHIFDDNFERLPTELKSLDKDVARQVFEGFLGHTVKKIRRNNRIPVPQFYKEKIMFLIPIKVFGTRTVVIAVEKIGSNYVANTILTMEMAYNCARLLTKPESNWLLISKK